MRHRQQFWIGCSGIRNAKAGRFDARWGDSYAGVGMLPHGSPRSMTWIGHPCYWLCARSLHVELPEVKRVITAANPAWAIIMTKPSAEEVAERSLHQVGHRAYF